MSSTSQNQPPRSTPANSEPGADDLPVTLIEPQAGWQPIAWRELWKSREIVYFLAWRDVKVRYRQTLLGALWAILQPALMMVIFTIVLGRLADNQAANLPYPLFAYTGLVAWSFFATAVSSAAQSVVNAERLITKIYFPRFAIPLAAVAAALIDLAMAGLLLVPIMVYYHQRPSWTLALAPLAVMLLALAALGFGAVLAALNVSYRDVRYALPFLIQVWLFATPSIYLQRTPADHPPTQSHDRSINGAHEEEPSGGRDWLAVNPLDGLVAFFRASVLGHPLPWRRLLYPALAVPAALLFACFYFRRMEDSFADVI